MHPRDNDRGRSPAEMEGRQALSPLHADMRGDAVLGVSDRVGHAR